MADPRNVQLNLDTLDRSESFEPFTFVLDGREITMKDPKEISWQDLQTIEVPAQFAKFAMHEDDRRFFLSRKLEGWKFNALFERYQEHYGLDVSGNVRGSLT